MIGTGAAILGASIIGAGASMWGASEAADAQQESGLAAQITQQRGQDMALAAQREALGFQREVWDGQRRNYTDATNRLSPFINSGTSANNLLASFYGLDGANQALGQNAMDRFYQSPDFQFAMRSGVGALDNSASARGSMLSGNQLRAVTEYGQGLGTQNLGNYLSRLSGISQQGQNASGMLGQLGVGLGNGVAGNVGNIGSNMANTLTASSNNIAQSQMAQGTAEASGYLGMTRGINSGLSNFLSLHSQGGRSSYGDNNLLSMFGGTPDYGQATNMNIGGYGMPIFGRS
jgi:hypothetical protein